MALLPQYIEQLPPVTQIPVTGTETIPVVQGGQTRALTLSAIDARLMTKADLQAYIAILNG